MSETVTLRKVVDSEYGGDVQRIRRVIAERGYECSLAEAVELWELFSASMGAGWMHVLFDDDEVWFSVEPYIRQGGETS